MPVFLQGDTMLSHLVMLIISTIINTSIDMLYYMTKTVKDVYGVFFIKFFLFFDIFFEYSICIFLTKNLYMELKKKN